MMATVRWREAFATMLRRDRDVHRKEGVSAPFPYEPPITWRLARSRSVVPTMGINGFALSARGITLATMLALP
jgi:hypothetical protein